MVKAPSCFFAAILAAAVCSLCGFQSISTESRMPEHIQAAGVQEDLSDQEPKHGGEGEQEKEKAVGSILVRGLPPECLVDILELGIEGAKNMGSEWEFDEVTAGEYTLVFKQPESTLSATIEVVEGCTVLLEVDFSEGDVGVSTAPRGFVFLRTETFSCGGAKNTVKIFQHRQTGLEFVLVPAGKFVMGSPEDEMRREEHEGPRHGVTIASFLMSRTEVTKAVWDKIGGEDAREWDDPVLPMENVSWFDVTEWCGKAGLRLPSEAEWEYACRAGTSTLFHFGTSVENLGDYAWYADIVAPVPPPPNPVAQKKPNAFGLYDMHGNIWEWCQDVYHPSYEGAPEDGTAWEEGDTNRVYRGGGWIRPAHYCRAARRHKCEPETRHYALGFRPVADLPEAFVIENTPEEQEEEQESEQKDTREREHKDVKEEAGGGVREDGGK